MGFYKACSRGRGHAMTIRKILTAPLTMITSKVFMLWMTGCGLIYYVLSAIWVKEAFGTFVMQLRDNVFMQVFFILFLICGYGNFMRASISVFKRNKLRFCAWILLAGGVLLFVSGFFMSASMRESGQLIVGEGNLVNPPWSSNSYIITSIDPGLKDRFSNTDIHQSIFAYQPAITLEEKASGSHIVGAFPPARLGDTFYHILNFGIAPEIELLRNGQSQRKGFMPLRILVPGSIDFFELTPLPYRFLVTIEPEKTVQKGRSFVSEFNFKKPLFGVTVYKGERIIAEGTSESDIRFDGFSLRFGGSTFWAQLEAVKDMGVNFIHVGIVLIIIGIPIYLLVLIMGLFRQREVDESEHIM